VATQAQDDGFHEIQLNGKQLVFVFMAATVVSVVIFLCGVLVGRGVRAERASGESAAANAAAETTPLQPAAPVPTPAGSDPTAAAPPPAVDDLSYFNRLEKPSAAAEQLKPAPDKGKNTPAERAMTPAETRATPPSPPSPPAAAPKEPAQPAPVRAAPAPAPAAAAEPGGSGFAVQIAALNVRSEADAIVKRLASKGYSAYVLASSSGTPSVYRVRVGKFPTRREAESIAAKLQKEEQFKPWITR
jgi:DedD protein